MTVLVLRVGWRINLSQVYCELCGHCCGSHEEASVIPRRAPPAALRKLLLHLQAAACQPLISRGSLRLLDVELIP